MNDRRTRPAGASRVADAVLPAARAVLRSSRAVAAWASQLGPAQQLQTARLWRRFRAKGNACWGVHPTYEEARAACPADTAVGYDHAAAAGMYDELMHSLEPNEYSVAFWLERCLPPGGVVFDFGGHVGVKYYALSEVLRLAAGTRWVVYDVNAVVERGRALAAERDAPGLSFTEHLGDASGVDVFLALGSLQYLERSLPELLSGLPERPRAVILSSTPMSEHPTYFTVQNIRKAFCPYRVQSRAELLAGMSGLGYSLVRSWTNPEKECPILDVPERSVKGYTSMYFTADALCANAR